MQLGIDSQLEEPATERMQESFWSHVIVPAANTLYHGDFINEELGADFHYSRSIRIAGHVFRIAIDGNIFELHPEEDDEYYDDVEEYDDEDESDEPLDDSEQPIRTVEIGIELDRRIDDEPIDALSYIDDKYTDYYKTIPLTLWEERAYTFSFTPGGLSVKKVTEYMIADEMCEDIAWHSQSMRQDDDGESAVPLSPSEDRVVATLEAREMTCVSQVDLSLVQYVLDRLFATE